jgi:acetoin utilization protein AcuB
MRHERTVEELMHTAVISLRATDTVSRARDQMELAEIHHLPVVDAHNHVVGVVSDRDLLRPNVAGEERLARVMRHPAHTVRANTPAHHAAALLWQHKIGSLPVVATDGQLIGIVTVSDFLVIACHALGGGHLSH